MTNIEMGDLRDRAAKVYGFATQWERLRHPGAGALRIALILTLPFVIWSNSLLLVIVWLAAAMLGPALFPVYVRSGADAPLLTRLTDAAQEWYESATPRERALDIFPCAVLVLPMLWALWSHLLFWGVYFYLAAVGSKGLFLYRLLEQKQEKEA